METTCQRETNVPGSEHPRTGRDVTVTGVSWTRGMTRMKWEYRYVQVSEGAAGSTQEMADQLNKLGKEGWEAVSAVPKHGVGAHYVLLRRPANQK